MAATKDTEPFLGVCYNTIGSKLLSVQDDVATVSVRKGDSEVTAKDPGRIYDFCWFPFSAQYSAFLTTGSGFPIHFWDATSSSTMAVLRASYLGYHQSDPNLPMAALSCTFNTHATHIYAGYNRRLLVFDVNRPGKHIHERWTSKTRKSSGQRGLFSTISFNPDHSGIYAVGSYNGSIGLYEERSGDLLGNIGASHPQGVTHLSWSPDGTYLISGGRKDSEIVVHDVRGTGKPLFSLQRKAPSNQRVYFDVVIAKGGSAHQEVWTGSADGCVLVYRLDTGALTRQIEISPGLSTPPPVNGITVSPTAFAVTTGGRRAFTEYASDHSSSSEDDSVCDESQGSSWNDLLVFSRP